MNLIPFRGYCFGVFTSRTRFRDFTSRLLLRDFCFAVIVLAIITSKRRSRLRSGSELCKMLVLVLCDVG
jgi:hypothetical protein